MMDWKPAFTFDDVSIEPAASDVLPSKTDVSMMLGNRLRMALPIIASAMDTVSESRMAIAMARLGGLAVLHRNMAKARQVAEVERIKKFEAGMVVNPITMRVDQTIGDALAIMREHKISGIPVTDQIGKLIGILTNRDVRFAEDPNTPVKSLMTCKDLVTVSKDIDRNEAKRILHQHRIEKLLVVDDEGHCTGLITVKDIERSTLYPNASKDSSGRLIAAAAIGCEEGSLAHCESLIDAGCDVLVIDTAHGHSRRVLEHVANIRRRYGKSSLLMAGNVATPEAVTDLIEAGTEVIKIGIGPGSICTTRIVAGIGVPQLSAIFESARICRDKGVTAIADGGIRHSGDIVKAIAAGADAVMIGSVFAGTDESPGEAFIYNGRSYKPYRGMGSAAAMARGSADRYFQEDISQSVKYVPEGVEGGVPYRGPIEGIINQLVGGLRAGMGYTGSRNLTELRRVRFRLVSAFGLRESHTHDIVVTRESPNYQPQTI